MISITDNGEGIQKDDLVMAVTRHAISKLDDDKLFSISTMGFRGEALASIGAVSCLSISSKYKDAADAWKIEVKAGEIGEIVPAVVKEGTKIDIYDLFYTTPARLKFLKSEPVEQQEIVKALQKVVLVNPNIDLILRNENKILLEYKKTNNVAVRIRQVMGEQFSRHMVHAKIKNEHIKVETYAILPDHVRRSSVKNFLYVNNRPVKDKLLTVAVKVAYQSLLVGGGYPQACVFVELPFDEVDVNVHPTKAEVRFSDPELVKNTIIYTIKTAIRNGDTKTDTVKDVSGLFEKPTVSFNNITSKPPSKTERLTAKQYTEFMLSNKPDLVRKLDERREEVINAVVTHNSENTQPTIPVSPTYTQNTIVSNQPFQIQTEKTTAKNKSDLGCVLAAVEEKYILTQTNNALLLIDREKACQRLEEKMLLEGLRKRMLSPAMFYDDSEENIPAVLKAKDMLKEIGFNYQYANATQILVTEMPYLLDEESSVSTLKDICAYARKAEKIEKENIAAIVAKHRVNKRTDIAEMVRKLEEKYTEEELKDICRKLTANDMAKLF
jgi:DNA mismatch repair protein MutL